MKRLLILILSGLLLGCASHLAYGPDGTMNASNYTINETSGPEREGDFPDLLLRLSRTGGIVMPWTNSAR